MFAWIELWQAVASSPWMVLVIRTILDGFVFVAFTYFYFTEVDLHKT